MATLNTDTHVLESEAVQLVATDASGLERHFFVHKCVLGAVPYFQAEQDWQARLPGDVPAGTGWRCQLPAHCDHAGCALLLCRLYARQPWPVPEWLRDGPESSVGAALLADMWSLSSIAKEAFAAVRMASWDPEVATTVGNLLPPALASASGEPAAARLPGAAVAAMVKDACTALGPAAAAQRDLAKRTLQRRREHGVDDLRSLAAALASCYLGKRTRIVTGTSNSGKTDYVYYEVVRQIPPTGLEMLTQMLHETVKARPDRFAGVSEAFRRLNANMHKDSALSGGEVRGRKDTIAIDSGSRDAFDAAVSSLLQVGAELVQSGHLSSEEYGSSLVHWEPSLVPAAAVQLLAEAGQVSLVASMVARGPTCFRPDLLKALRGEAAVEAATYLATKLRELDPAVIEVVGEMLVR